MSAGLLTAGMAGVWRGWTPAGFVLLALGAGSAAYVSPATERGLGRRRLLWPLVTLASAVVAYVLIGDTLSAGWSPIDDHEIMAFLGDDGRVDAREIPRLLMETEVGQPGSGAARYRPSYYGLRILETLLWGASPRAWYASHLAMFAATIALSWRFLARWLGVVPAAVLTLYFLTFECWSDIFTRLGPGEVYCALGSALYLEGMARIAHGVRGTRPPGWGVHGGWVMLGLGGWLAMGSKENFLLMLLPLWGVTGVLWWRGGLGRGGAAVAVALTLYGAVIACPVAVSVLRRGADVYLVPVTGAGRLGLVGAGLQRALEPLNGWYAALGLIVAMVVAASGPERARWRLRPVLRGGLLVGGLVALFASQFVFYNGVWPQTPGAPRYDFPGVLARPLVVVTGAITGLAVLRRLRVPGPLVRVLRAGLVALLVVLTLAAGWSPLREASAAHAAATREWTARLDRIAARLRQDPTRPVLVVSHDIGDYEPIFAIPRFFTAMRVANPLFLMIPVYRTDSAWTGVLASTLRDVALFGFGRYRPFEELPETVLPLAIGLSGAPPPPYEDVGSLWPLPRAVRP